MAGRDYWDRQLQFSTILDDFDEQLDWMRATSSAWSGSNETHHQATGSDARQWIEWTGEPGAHTMLPVFVHGGYWRALDAPMHRFVLAGLTRFSGVAANVEYRLMPGSSMDDLVADVSAALKSAEARVGAGSLLVVGHSAGAHLALCALRQSGLEDAIAGVVAISGLYDLEPVRNSFLQDEIGLDGETAETWSPLRWSKPFAARTLFVTGADETPVFQDQADVMAKATPGNRLRIEACHHMNLLRQLSGGRTALADAVEAHFPQL